MELPVIATEAAPDGGAALAEAAGRLAEGRYGWVALTSVNAVNRLLGQLGPNANSAPAKWAALGEGTAAALRRAGVEPEVVADVSTSAGLLDAFPPAPIGRGGSGDDPARTVLFPRAERVRGALAGGLRARGWAVDEVVAYRTVAAVPSPDSIDRRAPRRRGSRSPPPRRSSTPYASSDAKASRRRSRRSGPPRRAPRGKKASR